MSSANHRRSSTSNRRLLITRELAGIAAANSARLSGLRPRSTIATQLGSSWETRCACTPSLTLLQKSLSLIAVYAQSVVIKSTTLHRPSKMVKLKSLGKE